MGVAPARNKHSKTPSKPSILLAEAPLIGIDAMKTIQINIPIIINKQQPKSFRPILDFLRPRKYSPATDRRSPKPKEQRARTSKNNASIQKLWHEPISIMKEKTLLINRIVFKDNTDI